MKPKTLVEVAELVLRGEPFQACLKEFLEGFYLEATDEALAVEPLKLAESIPEIGKIHDAYLAAVAEALA